MDLITLCENAKNAKVPVSTLSLEARNNALLAVSEKIIQEKENILLANMQDIALAAQGGMSPALIDRLRLSDDRISAMAEGVRQVVDLPDPLGRILDSFKRPNNMEIQKVSVPLGVIGIIYESRPNVTLDAFALTFKSGNVAILKGGSDAINSNKAIAKAIREALKECDITPDALGLIEDTSREVTNELMRMRDYVDVLIPRGSAGLIRTVVNNSTIPVIETGSGNCHIYIDESADVTKAVNIVLNAKTQRIGVCNACESLVIHEKVKNTVLREVAKALEAKNVEIRADEEALPFIENASPASEEDFNTEYLDLIISVKTVKNIDEAIKHINNCSTGHSECIITEIPENAEKFLNEIDSACVYWNVSTRFTDGFEFGFGAEIGISTQKLHARGPMGLNELTTYKYKIRGNGQIRG